jgi:CoA:oxalate CoA-transferase
VHPLDGIRVLDLSRVVAGPFAGRMLSDLGADVVKVEPPEGDVSRVWGENRHGVSGFFQQQNAGKRDMCIDLRTPEGVELVISLASKAHVVIENFRAGVMDRLGLGWPVLQAANPALVMCSISGFGANGPASDRAAYAPVIQAESGIVSRQAILDDTAPTDPALSIADYDAGLHALVAILSALRCSERTGVGTWIDLSMIDAMLATDDYVHHSIDASPVDRLGGTYLQAGDGTWLLVSSPIKHLWRIASSVGVTSDVPADAPVEERIAGRRRAIEAWVASHATVDDLTHTLDSLNVAWGRVRTMEEAITSPTAAHRGVVVQVDDRSGSGTTRGVVNSPYRFSAWESGVRGGAPRRGEHNAEVIADWLGTPSLTEQLTNAGTLLAE